MQANRYTSVAVVLHWTIAILILSQIAGGLYMHNLPNTASGKFDLYQLHKSFGLSILGLSLLRFGWRLAHRPPAPPASMPGWQIFTARVTHWLFYFLMIVTPLVGLAMVSVSPKDIPTFWFGVVPVPHIGFLDGLGDAAQMEHQFLELHEKLAYAILGLFALHIGAVLKHHLIDKDDVLRSMSPLRVGAMLGIGALFAALAFGVVTYFNDQATPVTIDDQTRVIEPAVTAQENAAENLPDTDTPQLTVVPAEGEQPSAQIQQPPPTDVPDVVGFLPIAGPCQSGAPANWIVDNTQSALRFTGSQGGQSFTGDFSDFTAEISFDDDALDQSWISVSVATASASTRDELRDSTIPGGEWFDVKKHPAAKFTSCQISKIGEGRYEATGPLVIKDVSREITLSFQLSIEGNEARASGSADLLRTNFDLGSADSWLNQEGVALEVRVDTEIVATHAN